MAGEWQQTQFGNLLAESVRNGVYKPKEFHGRGLKVVNMGELFAYPRLRSIPMKRVQLSDVEGARFNVRKGDLLFARRSLVAEGAGKCSVVLDVDEPTTFESSIIRARPDPSKADALFLFYFFNSIAGLHALDTIRRQVAVAGITGSDLVRLEVPVPRIEEQRAIAHILGALDDKIELNRRMNETLEAIAQAIFKSWFVDAMGDGLPKGWRVTPLPDAIEVNPLRSLQKRETAPYVDMQNMPTQGHRPFTWIDRKFGSGMRFINGDTLLARITPCLENGKTAFVDWLEDGQIGWGSTEYIVLRPKPPLPPEYAYYLARSEELRTHAIQNMTGSSGRQRVPSECFAQFEIAVPPEPVARRFGEVAKRLMSLIRANDEQSRTLAALRDALLPKLISGELRVEKFDKSLKQKVAANP